MDVTVSPAFRGHALAEEAAELMRACVQCGYCTETCPTWRRTGAECDPPRGRIQLVKELVEGTPASADPRHHLDRCLTCRSCETTCPQKVRYGRILDIGRELVERRTPRPRRERWMRAALRAVVPRRRRFAALLGLGRLARPVLPAALRARVPPAAKAGPWPDRAHARAMLVWRGCVQPSLAPDIDAAAARVLDRFGIRLIAARTGCCGALSHHLAQPDAARAQMRDNIDAIWREVEAGAEAIVMTASGCGAHVRDYGELLRDDPRYAERARRLSAMTRDLSEVVAAEWQEGSFVVAPPAPASPGARPQPRRIAVQSPCSLQHGQKLAGVVERLLRRAGFKLVPVAYPFMCCGSAGTTSILQPEIAQALRTQKLEALTATRPTAIATANIGCLHHLAETSPVPVRHWIELIDEVLPPAAK